MRLEKRKKLEKKLFTIMLAGVLVVTSVTTALAASGSNTWSIGPYDIDGSNKVVATYGKGTTGGSAKPEKNYVYVAIFNKKDEIMSSGGKTKSDAAVSKTLLGVNPKRVYSFHGVYDSNNQLVDNKLYGINTKR